jgi:hypothetical protein
MSYPLTKDASLRGGVEILIIPMFLKSVQSPLGLNEKDYLLIFPSFEQPSYNPLTIFLQFFLEIEPKSQFILPQCDDSVYNESSRR